VNRAITFEQAVSSQLPIWRRYALRYLKNDADAEDAVQDALVLAWRFLDSFKGQAQLSTWLTAIVTNCARMMIRRRKEMLSLSEEVADGICLADLLPDPKPSPERACVTQERLFRIRAAVRRLSPTQRTAFELHYFHGLRTGETAKLLGDNLGAVKARISRARTQLKSVLAADA
jgi:RNA polymerase sigma-70 factor, ECF subfamily